MFLDSENFVPDGYRACCLMKCKLKGVCISRELLGRFEKECGSSDFNLFPKLKEHLKGKRFGCDEELKSEARKCFQKQNANFFYMI